LDEGGLVGGVEVVDSCQTGGEVLDGVDCGASEGCDEVAGGGGEAGRNVVSGGAVGYHAAEVGWVN